MLDPKVVFVQAQGLRRACTVGGDERLFVSLPLPRENVCPLPPGKASLLFFLAL